MEIRTAFHKKLREIQDDVLAMGSMVEKAIKKSVDALKQRDMDKANEVISGDIQVNKKRFEIEQKCTQLIATQQPMAGDLRSILCVLNIITDIERIGDYAVHIARRIISGSIPASSLQPLHRSTAISFPCSLKSIPCAVMNPCTSS